MEPVATRAYLSKVERGRANISIGKIHEVCEALDVSPLTVHVLAYAGSEDEIDQILAIASAEAKRIISKQGRPTHE